MVEIDKVVEIDKEIDLEERNMSLAEETQGRGHLIEYEWDSLIVKV